MNTLRTTLSGLAAILGGAPALPCQAPLYSLRGTNAAVQYGSSIALIGDTDGDGASDVALAIPGQAEVRIHSGATGRLLRQLTGRLSDSYGTLVCNAGDVDADNCDDLLIGAPQAGTGPGFVEVYSGRDGRLLHLIAGRALGDLFGGVADGAGDINGDGFDDVIVGATNSGYADVLSGRDGSRLSGVSLVTAGFRCVAVAGGRDIDADSFDDFLVTMEDPSSPTPVREVFVISGRSKAQLHRHQSPVIPARSDFGQTIVALGDVDGDGFGDYAIGAPGANAGDSGDVWLHSGATHTAMVRFMGVQPGDGFGHALARAGDVDGDGLADLLVGAPVFSGNPGYCLALNRRGKIFRLAGLPGDLFGAAIAGNADLDGDGLMDVLVSAPANDNIALNGGLVEAFASPSTRDPGRVVTYGRACADSFGRLSRIDVTGLPAIGGAFDVRVRAAPFLAATSLRLAVGRNNVPLGIVGMPGCTLLTQLTPSIEVAGATDPLGTTHLSLTVPSAPALVGKMLNFQWAAVDPQANTVGMVTSDAAEITIGGG